MAVHLPGALPKLEVLDLQENGRITDAQALVSALAGGALPCLAVLRFVGTAHLKARPSPNPNPNPYPNLNPNPDPSPNPYPNPSPNPSPNPNPNPNPPQGGVRGAGHHPQL